MTFGSSPGIIFGANVGTTITGWLVALFGFKLKLGAVMLPLILVGHHIARINGHLHKALLASGK